MVWPNLKRLILIDNLYRINPKTIRYYLKITLNKFYVEVYESLRKNPVTILENTQQMVSYTPLYLRCLLFRKIS